MPLEPILGLHFETNSHTKYWRRELTAKVRKRRICVDDRNYAPIPYTIKGPVAVGDYSPMWPVDRNYWIAKVTADVGKHDAGDHPDDGTPGGQALELNLRVVDGDTDSKMLNADDRISIDENKHRDSATEPELGPLTKSDFNIRELETGQHVYVRVTQVGSSRPGTDLVVTLWLVPKRWEGHTA